MAVLAITTYADWKGMFHVKEDDEVSKMPVVLLVAEGRWGAPDRNALYWYNRIAEECNEKMEIRWALIVLGDADEELRAVMVGDAPYLRYYEADGTPRAADEPFKYIDKMVFQKE
jgi:hypothetical protein